MNISIDDQEKDKRIIIQNFMKELCSRDDEDNKGLTASDRVLNIYSVEGIRRQVLGAFEDIEYVKRFLREHILENRDNEPLELLDNEQSVRLTNAGRARCHEYGL
jgi:hypothetical protein